MPLLKGASRPESTVKSTMTMTTAQFKDKLETLDNSDLESYSDLVEEFGASLLEFCDRPDVADETVRNVVDLDDMCCRALRAIMRGETLPEVHAHITDDHSAAPGARTILTDLHGQWNAPVPA